jgi:very-short-patch-repair endonuclease
VRGLNAMKDDRTVLARRLRGRQTEAEQVLWFKLQNRQVGGVKFRRQQTIGDFIADFVSFEEKLIVEVDGGQHQSLTREKDKVRTRWLESQGFRILRFWNNDVLENMDGVLYTIQRSLDRGLHPHLSSPVKGEES